MSPKTSFWLLLRLAILLAAFLIQSSEGASYQDFTRQHIDFPKTRARNNNAYCDLMMRRRGMMNRRCKPTNTFIIRSANDVKKLCQGEGRPAGGNLFKSRRRVRVILCRSTGRYPNCRYRGRSRNSRIRVGCVNREPVHFDGFA